MKKTGSHMGAGSRLAGLEATTGFEAVEDGACPGVDHVAMLAPPACGRHPEFAEGYRCNDAAA